jgi:hypothetical protein
MIAALLQIIDNTKRENHTICLNINGVIFFRAVVCRLSFLFQSEHDENVKKISEGNRGTCCQGKRSLLKKCIYLMKNFRLHCVAEGAKWEKKFPHTKDCVLCIILRASHVLCAARKIA